MYNLSYLNLPPEYYCVDELGKEYVCSMAETCEDKFNFDLSNKSESFRNGFVVDTENHYLNNWIEIFDLRCSERWEIGLFGALFFIGHVIGSLSLS